MKWLRWLWLRPQIRVFKMNDCDWVAARNETIAMNFYVEMCSCEPDIIEETEPSPLSRKAMKKIQYTRDDQNGKWSFREQLNHCILTGEKFPQLFATTEY